MKIELETEIYKWMNFFEKFLFNKAVILNILQTYQTRLNYLIYK